MQAVKLIASTGQFGSPVQKRREASEECSRPPDHHTKTNRAHLTAVTKSINPFSRIHG